MFLGKVIEGYLIKVLEGLLLVLLSNILLLLFPKTIELRYLIKVLEGLLLEVNLSVGSFRYFKNLKNIHEFGSSLLLG